jgi:hypothetical protein
MTAFHDRVATAKRLVTRAIRQKRPYDAASAMAPLREDLTDTGRTHTIRIALMYATDYAGARYAYAVKMVDWLINDSENLRIRPPLDLHKVPTIMIEPDGLPRMIEYLESALADARLGIYWRGSQLVRVCEKMGPGYVETVHVMDIDEHLLVDLGTQAAVWMMPGRENTGDGKTVNCPLNVARGLLARRGVSHNVTHGGVALPQIAGVVHSPTLRSDGSLLDLPGHDRETGLFLAFGNTTFPKIPDEPTLEDAVVALDRLDELLEEVYFIEGPSSSVALSAILTALVRPSLPAAPMHAITATTFGTGKSYLADVVAMIATGRTAAPLAAGPNDEEFEKRLGAALIAGAPIISIDNVTRAVNGDLLNQLLTQECVNPRRLGKSENVEVSSTATVLMNGNNLQIPADMTRRVLLCSLDARVERPELMEYQRDPLSMARESRGEYVAAGLTILRAYIAAGRPVKTKPLGSFGAWSDSVRGALIWLGEADPVDSMEAVRAADPHRQATAAIMSQWDEHVGDARATVNEVIAAATVSRAAPEFREALLAVAGDQGAINGKRLGTWLGLNKGRILDGRSFEPAGQRKGVATWRLNGARHRPAAVATVHDINEMTALAQ